MGFAERVKQHDEKAIGMVEDIFEQYGFLLFPFGMELLPELQKELRHINTETSMLLRYRPDRLAILPRKKVLLLEIKSEANGYNNFAVEFEAWYAACLWNKIAGTILYVMVDLNTCKVYGFVPDEIQPECIYVPKLNDLNRVVALNRTKAKIVCELSRHITGSGAPYFLIPKASLKPVHAYITQ